MASEKIAIEREQIHACLNYTERQQFKRAQSRESARRFIKRYSFIVKHVAVPRLPDAFFLPCQFFHGFKTPRLFAFWASRLPDGFWAMSIKQSLKGKTAKTSERREFEQPGAFKPSDTNIHIIMASEKIAIEREQIHACLNYTERQQFKRAQSRESARRFIKRYSFIVKHVAVPRLPDAFFLPCQFFHGFKTPRLFAFWASRLPDGFWAMSIKQSVKGKRRKRLKDGNLNSRGLLSPRILTST